MNRKPSNTGTAGRESIYCRNWGRKEDSASDVAIGKTWLL